MVELLFTSICIVSASFAVHLLTVKPQEMAEPLKDLAGEGQGAEPEIKKGGWCW